MYRHNWEDKVFASELRFMKAKLAYEQALLDEVRLAWQCQQFSRPYVRGKPSIDFEVFRESTL